jgi:hypothetical protein
MCRPYMNFQEEFNTCEKLILTYMNVNFEPMKYFLRQDSYLTNNIQNITIIIINIIIDNGKHE